MKALYGALAGAIGLLACSAGALAQQNLDTFRIAIGGFGSRWLRKRRAARRNQDDVAG